MPNFDIVREVKPKKTFRVASIMGTFDLETENIIEHFKGNIALPNEWSVGLIVGNSGTGKTTIAKELFPNAYITKFEYTHETILDDMPSNRSVEEFTKALNAVGFSSPPSWLKPYQVLSNGEKMRCDLAKAILSDDELFVFDEFTSVVDRNVAKIGSFAMQKAIRKQPNKKMIAVTCHFDVEDWLLPDWVFNTNDMTFHLCDAQKKNRPDIRLDIYEVKKNKDDVWKLFAKYHYLSHYHNKAAHVYVCTANGDLAGFCSILPFPHPKLKNARKEHRVVVLPDYQGVGIGRHMTDAIAQMYKDNGYTYLCVSSAPAFIHSRSKSPKWIVTRKLSRTGKGSETGKIQNFKNKKSTSFNRMTVSFKYRG